jgi:Undecaprenyl-phosphate glucose phosphotransferase
LAFRNFSAIRRQEQHQFVWKGLAAVALAFSIFLTLVFFLQLGEHYSRGTLLFQIVAVALCVITTRLLFHSWLHSAIARYEIEARCTILIGSKARRDTFSVRLKDAGIKTVGSFDFPAGRDNGVNSNLIHKIITEIRSLRPDDIIILAEQEISPTMLDLISSFAEIPAGVHIVPVGPLNSLSSARIAQFGNMHSIQLYRTPLSKFDLFIKRIFDLVFATIGLMVLSPLFLVVSVAIKLDSVGPIFYRQARHGFNNDEIHVLKFRSMSSTQDGVEFKQATENDPRVTRIGKVLRRTNIDELPQLINVLLGQMSIVGPRPHATAHNALFDKVITPFSRRHNVKPGITGWAQINGYRGATDTLEKMKRRIEFDLYYIDNWSFLLDLKIIVMTLFTRKAFVNAY